MSAIRTADASDLVAFLNTKLPHGPPITPDSNLVRDLGLDSLAAMDLLMELENHFDIAIPINSLPAVDTVADLAALIEGIRRGVSHP
jgi:acyl carrier protein